jgi:hypothetical protein
MFILTEEVKSLSFNCIMTLYCRTLEIPVNVVTGFKVLKERIYVMQKVMDNSTFEIKNSFYEPHSSNQFLQH